MDGSSQSFAFKNGTCPRETILRGNVFDQGHTHTKKGSKLVQHAWHVTLLLCLVRWYIDDPEARMRSWQLVGAVRKKPDGELLAAWMLQLKSSACS